jgi:hypothetical protein
MESILLVAIFASVVTATSLGFRAWRELHRERHDSDARIAALAADIFAPDAEQTLVDDGRFNSSLGAQSRSLFAQTMANPTWSAQGLYLVVAGALVLMVAAAAALGRAGERSGTVQSAAPVDVATDVTQASGVAAATGETAESPLELIKLEHRRDGRTLAVSGVIRNPPEGSALSSLAVVILLFKDNGGLAGSGSAELDHLAPGLEKPFAVAVPMTDGAGRYRVTLRAAGRLVPHIDRRS